MSENIKKDKLTGFMKAVSNIGYTLYLIRGASDGLREYNSSLLRNLLDIYNDIGGIARNKDIDPTIDTILKPYKREAFKKTLRRTLLLLIIAVLLFFLVLYLTNGSVFPFSLSLTSMSRAALRMIRPASYNMNGYEMTEEEFESNGIAGLIAFFVIFILIFFVIPSAVAFIAYSVMYIPGSLIGALFRLGSARRSSDTKELITCLNASIAAFNIIDICLDELEDMELTQLDLLHSLLSLDVLDSKYSGYIPATQIYTYLSDGRCACLEGEGGAYALWDADSAAGLVTDDLYSAEMMFRENRVTEAQSYLAAEIEQKLRYMGELFTYASSYRDMLEAQLDEERSKAPKRAAIPHFDRQRVGKEADSFMKRSVIAEIAGIAEQVCNETAELLS